MLIFYLVVGLLLAWLFCRADGGVQQLVLLNIPAGSFTAVFVCGCSAAVSLLSYPVLYLPIVELLHPLLWPSQRAADGSDDRGSPHKGRCERSERRVRLVLLVLTTSVAFVTHSFGIVASFIGCLTILQGLLLPPLIHLRLHSVHIEQRLWRIAVCTSDVLLATVGLVACVGPASTVAMQLLSSMKEGAE